MKIAIGSDHTVLPVKMAVSEHLKDKGHEIIDYGVYDHAISNYTQPGKKVADAVSMGEVDYGIVICGTGVGISVTANKTFGVRAALVRDVASAVWAKEHLNANVISVGGIIVGPDFANEIVDRFLAAEFKGEEEDLAMIKKLEELEEAERTLEYKDQVGNDHFYDEFLAKWDNGDYMDDWLRNVYYANTEKFKNKKDDKDKA